MQPGRAVTEPQPADLSWPRYSVQPFPPYRFVPGKSLHPRHRPQGHSYGLEKHEPILLLPEHWSRSDDYLYGIDLYNYAYWWECHEVFEGLWNMAGHHTEQGNFFQALIQLAAANLKGFMGNPQAMRNLLHRGLVRLQRVPEPYYMGIAVAGFTQELQQCMTNSHRQTPSIRLDMPDQK
jgi:predicted metal-dependent hydrolase